MAYLHGKKMNSQLVIVTLFPPLMMNNADWMRSSVSDRRMRHSYWSCMSYSDSGSCMRKRFLVHHRVETVHWVGGVFHGASGTVGFDEGVAALHYVTVASFVLVFDVTGDGVLKIQTNKQTLKENREVMKFLGALK